MRSEVVCVLHVIGGPIQLCEMGAVHLQMTGIMQLCESVAGL